MKTSEEHHIKRKLHLNLVNLCQTKYIYFSELYYFINSGTSKHAVRKPGHILFKLCFRTVSTKSSSATLFLKTQAAVFLGSIQIETATAYSIQIDTEAYNYADKKEA